MKLTFNYQDVEELATLMHDRYETLSIVKGWKTQKQCQVPFKDLPEKNKQVMLDVAGEVLLWFSKKVS